MSGIMSTSTIARTMEFEMVGRPDGRPRFPGAFKEFVGRNTLP